MANSIFKSPTFRLRNPLHHWYVHKTINVSLRFPNLHSHLLFHSPTLRHFSSHHLLQNIPLLRRRFRPLFLPMSTYVDSSDSSPAAKTVRVMIKGRVQGVCYRDWTVENAKELRLNGWVRNRRDGSVEALFSGSPKEVEEMEQRCRRGPPAAMVTGLQVILCTGDDPGITFERKPTV